MHKIFIRQIAIPGITATLYTEKWWSDVVEEICLVFKLSGTNHSLVWKFSMSIASSTETLMLFFYLPASQAVSLLSTVGTIKIKPLLPPPPSPSPTPCGIPKIFSSPNTALNLISS